MSEISHFQKYSQKENHVTNNTLLMFRHIYRHSPQKFQGFLNALLDEDEAISIGLTFEQQVGKEASIPDAQITQKPIEIYIEAKMDGGVDIAQLQNHIKGVQGKDGSNTQIFLIALTKGNLKSQVAKELETLRSTPNLKLHHITYDDVEENLAMIYGDHEEEMSFIVHDYIRFLQDNDLLQDKYKVAVIPCGKSYDANAKHRAYFEPLNRREKDHVKYMGLYKDKCIKDIGEISKIVIARLADDQLVVDGKNDLSKKEMDRLHDLIKDSRNGAYPTLGDEPLRFYLLENLLPVNLKKESKGGFMSLVYKDLMEFVPEDEKLPDNPSFQDITSRIVGSSFR